MDWNTMFSAAMQPTYDDMADYIGGEGKRLWNELFAYMERAYAAKPKMTYSGCSEKPGWNVKFQKSGQSFGTFYPEEDGFSVFMVVSYKLGQEAEAILPGLGPKFREQYENAHDFMKNGRYMMPRIETRQDLEDYKKFCAIKLKPKSA
jgi:hypothetical protein